MRRTILLLSAMAFALALVGGAAWAANITGDSGDNKLQGTSNGDNMDGKAGNDTLEGMSGGDSVLGGNGDDLLYGGREDGNNDPPGFRLAQSNHRLGWSSGSYVAFNYREKSAVGYPTPCPIPCTHWYTYRSNFIGSPYYIDGGRTLVSEYRAAFYNYDFGRRYHPTTVQHRTNMYVFNNSRFNYYWKATYEGEFHRLLRSSAVTS